LGPITKDESFVFVAQPPCVIVISDMG
jgi:hypothetical protein